MKRASLAAVPLVLSFAAMFGSQREDQNTQENPSREIMWQKLDLSHDILDALVLDDFEALEAYAEDLDALGGARVL